jgi:type II secretory pathway pseudopilin PulG
MSTGRTTSPSSPRANEAAFSLLETLCGMTLMFVGMLSLASSTVTGIATKETNRENARATNAARQFLESMQMGDVAFENVFRAYTLDPATATVPEGVTIEDLPPGLLSKATRGIFVGKAQELQPILARTFEVPYLKPHEGSTAALGEVCFPVSEGEGGMELREDVAGRDLNGDGFIDSENHADDYKILPVTVKVRWKGTRGAREFELHSLLVRK